MFLKLSILLLACTIGLSACKTTTVEMGEGPIRLLLTRIALFEKYRGQDSPSYFALSSVRRSSSYTYCSPANLNCNDDVGAKALSLFDARAKKEETNVLFFQLMLRFFGMVASRMAVQGLNTPLLLLYLNLKGQRRVRRGAGMFQMMSMSFN
jgi:hypothetical protein